jgi:hypothetical protein
MANQALAARRRPEDYHAHFGPFKEASRTPGQPRNSTTIERRGPNRARLASLGHGF